MGTNGSGKSSSRRTSGEEQKKVAVAAVLAINPDGLPFDEPMGGLDPRSRQWLLGLLEALQGAGARQEKQPDWAIR